MDSDLRHLTIQRVTLVGAAVNAGLAFCQILVGFFGHSQALLADGLHTLSDLGSDFLVLVASKQASRSADDNHPYGHARIETLASVILGFALILVGLSIGYRGVDSISNSNQLIPEPLTLVFAALAIVSKEWLYRYTSSASKRVHSTMLESNAWHHRSDALSSIIVVIGISGQMFGLPFMDAAAAIIVAIMISVMGYKLSRRALDELIDTSLDSELVAKINQKIQAIEGVMEVHSLRSRSMGGLGYIDAEIRVNPRLTVSEAHHISINTEQQIKGSFPQIADVTIHIDPLTESDHDIIRNLPGRGEILFKLFSVWEGITNADKICNIHLHYLKNQIEIDIILPLEFALDKTSIIQQELKQKTSQIANIGKINIYYQ